VTEGRGFDRTRAFEVAGRSPALPDLTAVDVVVSVTDPVDADTVTTYFDTVDLRLAERQITLRRTASGVDAGWDLRMRSEHGAATEVHTDLGSDDVVPGELVELVRASVRDRELVPVVALRTVRVERRLLDAGGRELARLGDDEVRGVRFTAGGAELSSWREVEIDLLGGGPELLDALAASLGGAGLTPVATSRLHRALGRVEPGVVDLRDEGRDVSVGAAIRERLGAEVATLLDRDSALRAARPGAVHELRVAARRLHGDLATWRPFLHATRTGAVRDELRWLGGVLGGVRDAEMLDARLPDTVRDLPDDMVVGPVLERVERELAERRGLAADGLAAALDSARYFALLDALDALVSDPPFTARAAEPAGEALARRFAQAIRRMERALAALDGPATAGGRATHLHEVRKAARRAGYAAEALEPRFGPQPRSLVQPMVDLQDVLGEHHDSAVTSLALRDIGSAARVAGESAFTYGILHGVERDRTEAAEQAFEESRQALNRHRGPDRGAAPR
jgi:CHAD domain-containing protein